MNQWIIEKTDSVKYPYLIKIVYNNKIVLELLTKSTWPGEGQQLFCIRTQNSSELFKVLSVVEQYSIKRINKRGAILSIIIDRASRKRCEFLFVSKQYKTKSGTYEQIFWRSQSFFREKSSKIKKLPKGTIKILIDINERYAYELPLSKRENLPVGDYAVKNGNKIVGIVERKTFSDFLHSLSRINNLHLLFTELGAYSNSAVVVEAPYHYFLDAKRVKPLYPSLCEQTIHELLIEHPGVHLIFVDNRKVGRLFCESFLRYAYYSSFRGNMKLFSSSKEFYEIKNTYQNPEEFMRAVGEFNFKELQKNFPQWSEFKLRKLLKELRDNNKIILRGRGINARWYFISNS